ncbi:MAG: ABC transporter substrate-binding protein [Chloroflexota bacterium]
MRRWKSFSSLMVLGLVLAACQSGSSQSAGPTGSTAASADGSRAPFAARSYPADAPADCAYGGEFSQIKAVDEQTVEFDLCYPDPAFLSKIGFSSNGIQDSDYLAANMVNHKILALPNGTGPYKLKEHIRGDHLTVERFDGYWGDKAIAQQVIFQWNSEAAARLLALQSGTVDGIDNPAPGDVATIEGDAGVTLYPREAMNVFYLGFNNTFKPFDNEKVRQALAIGIDRQRILDTFYPTGSSLADYFTPCNIEFACEGNPWPAFDATTAKSMLAAAGFPNGFSSHIYMRDVDRPYLHDANVVATELQDQLANLGITVDIVVQESGTYLDNQTAGLLDGFYLLGWIADYPDPTNFLDYHFNNDSMLGFGTIDPSIRSALDTGAQTLDADARRVAYAGANNAILEHVPMIPIVHGASHTVFKKDVTGAHASPLAEEVFAGMDPGGRDTLIWMQSAYPISLYCADEEDGETFRVCDQIFDTLYAPEVGRTAPEPSLATSCDPNDDGSVWTCTLRGGVRFHDGAFLDANDVVDTFAVQWDLDHPLHIGRTGTFAYWTGLFGTNLNTPPPAS